MKRSLIVYTCLLVVAVVAYGFIRQAHAITLIPPSLEFVDVQPGETISTKIKLFNETAEPISQFASTANFTALDETGTPNFLPESNQEDLAGWIKVGVGPYAIQPGERVEIPVTIEIPTDADPGGHYGAVLFSSQAPDVSNESGQVAIAQKIGSLILVRVRGDINELGSIAEFTTRTKKSSFSRLPIDFSLRFQNSGNVHLRPTGSLTIRNVLGGTSSIIPMNSGQSAVLPSSIRMFEATWEKSPNGTTRGNFFQEFGYEWRNFALGPYTANLILTYGESNDRTVNATLRFWVMPWRVIILSLLIVILVIWLIVMLVRQYNRWILSRAGSQPRPK